MNKYSKSWRDMLDEHDPNYSDMQPINDDGAIDAYIGVLAVVAVVFWLAYNFYRIAP